MIFNPNSINYYLDVTCSGRTNTIKAFIAVCFRYIITCISVEWQLELT